MRECFPVEKQEAYGAALRYVNAGDTHTPRLHEGVTPFLLHHIQFLLEEPHKDDTLTYWEVMNRLANKIMEKSSLLDGRNNPALQQKLLDFFMIKVLQAYQQGATGERMIFAQHDLENLPINERLLRNFSFLAKVEDGIMPYYTFSHSHFRDYFLARLLFEGRIREVDFDKGRYPDAYRLYQDCCWKRIGPKGAYRYDWDPVAASALPCFAFQVMMRKHGGELPLKRPSMSSYFRVVFKHWQPQTWQAAKDLAARQAEGHTIGAELEAIRQRHLLEHTARELDPVVDFTAKAFRHPIYRDVFAFLHYQEQGREAALAFLDQSPFGWLFRRERHWLEYGEQTDAYSLVYPVKDNDSAYGILQTALEIESFTDFDREVYAALQTPALLERYYAEATRLHLQIHAATLPALLLNDIPFPEQFAELSLGGGATLTGDWDLSAFENLEVLDLSGVDVAQLRIAKCPPLLQTIIHPQADQIPIPEDCAQSIECLTRSMEAHWTRQAPDTPLPPEMVEVEGGTFEMGKGWFEAYQVFSIEYLGQEIPDMFRVRFPTYQAQVDRFFMAKYPVTVGEFARFVKATGYRTRAERFGFAFGAHVFRKVQDNRTIKMYLDYLLPGLHWRHSVWGDVLLGEDSADLPVVYISYEDAQAYAQWLTDTIGKGRVYRLPTEAEWEYAAKGGQLSEGYLYAGSDDIDEVAHYGGQDERRPVGAAHLDDMGRPNELGLYDMSGNVYEWCSDWFDQEYYAQCKAEEPVQNPAGPETGTLRVVRGGSWNGIAAYCRTAIRDGYPPDFRLSDNGFRLVFVPQ
ncbi:MAG: formylglycine-generating enzyme family protein [Haliscomenobacter sp.]|nr:formylglycine-generating enzyme family protein [Haliscomenobacter sp.]